MRKDANGAVINEGDLVRILEVPEYWFDYMSSDDYDLLQAACKRSVKVEYFCEDGRVSLMLPPTLEEDGDYISNSVSLLDSEVVVVEHSS